MIRADIVSRARSAIGLDTVYRLGAGAPFTAPTPKDESGACDCSGFVCWVLGISRHQPSFQWLVALNGGWMNTDGMAWDGIREGTGFFRPSLGIPGDIVVYPGKSTAQALKIAFGNYRPAIGHVGIYGSNAVIHCSNGNYRNGGDAIQETEMDVFNKVPYRVFLTFAGV